ncbi:MAG: winged helix-turn-helix domain-containing tetratricopeptide repeat protein, partial [Gammaproteobacteria bacterium]
MQFEFEDYVLDLDRRELTRGSKATAVGPQVFDLLVYLVENRERVVSKDDLLDVVWAGRIVSESTLTSHINAVRKAIGDSGAEQRLIRTVARKGFRFVGDVREAQSSDGFSSPRTEPAESNETPAHALALPDKPSIAALPFQNMSGDPEQEYFADGVVDDIITALSRMRWLFVIARNSSFTYKGRVVDVKQVGRELGVGYVLEGSVRKAANRVRITGQLIDATTGGHLWADRFEGTLDDIFELQDQVTASVVGAITPQLERAEIERAKRKPTESLDAYDYYLRGMANLHQGSREAINEALPLFNKAIELDADFASAYAMAAWCYFWRKVNGWMSDRSQEVAEGARLARRAVELGRDDAVALTRGGHALSHFVGDLDGGIALLDRALVLNPNLAAAWFLGGFLRVWHGEPDGAIEHFARAMRLSPLDPEMYRMQAGMAVAHLFAGRFDAASSWAEKAFRDLPSFLMVVGIIAASHALAG